MTARFGLWTLLALIVAAVSGSFAVADTIWWGSGAGRGLQAEGRVLRIDLEKQELIYESQGRQVARSIEQIKQLVIDNEPAFNAAEEQFFAAQYDKAVEGYLRTLRSTSKDWLRAFGAVRLADAAGKSGRFDAAVSAYISLVRLNPSLASRYKPAVPTGRTTFLDTAVAELNSARGQVSGDAQKQAILSLLLEVQQARKDQPAANAVLEELLKLNIGSTDDPAARSALASIRLGQARNAADAKDWKKVVETIQENRGLFSEPSQQADAMFLLAEARYELADPKNRTEMLDVALDYMRLVAHFKDVEGRPHVADALLKTALIHERLGGEHVATAIALYRQIAAEFASDPAGATAKKAVERLESDGG
jgi:tetratricopeptide (TPR) repeat protein